MDQKNVNLWKITFLNVRIIFSPNEYKKWGKKYLNKNLNLNNWNLKTVIQLTPFLFGFSNMLWSRYQDQIITSIFGQNLPGTKIIKEEMSWETFKFIKSKSIYLNNIKKIDLYTNSSIFQIEDSNKKKFIGIIFTKEKRDLNPNFSQQYSFDLVQTITGPKKLLIVLDTDTESDNTFSKIKNIYYDLDELPIKMESIIRKSSNLDKDLKNSIFKTELNKVLTIKNKEKILFTKRIDKQKLIPNYFSKIEENPISNNFSNGVLTNPKNFSQEILFPFNKNEVRNNKENILKSELNFLFYIQGIQSNLISNFSNYQIPNYSFRDHCSTETFNILKKYLKIKNTKIDSIRTFSGYYYPDFYRENVYAIKLKNILEKKRKDYFLIVQLPVPGNFLVFIKDDSLINSNCCHSLPISTKKDNFLGKNFSDKTIQNKTDWKASVLQEYFKIEKKNFGSFKDSDADRRFLYFKQKNKLPAIIFEENFLTELLEKNIITNYFYNNNLIFPKEKLIYHYLPFTEYFLIEKNSNSTKISDLYKKTPTIATFLKDKELPFQKKIFNSFQSWEPLSLTSWTLVTQFYIGLFLIYLVRDLYKDYGKELVEYSIEYASISGVDVEEVKEQYLYDEPDYRLIRKIEKGFKDIAGIDKILLQLGEIVWFLRNQGRSVKLKTSIPKGILLTGPPGTGKTLLVQAIAGEAQVPIIVESGSLLTDPQQKVRGVERLKKIFNHARQLSPCIIFIDEVDTLGERRQNIIQTPMGSDELIESIYEKPLNKKENLFFPKPLNLEEDMKGEKDLEYQLFHGDDEKSFNKEKEKIQQKIQQKIETKKTRLSLLTQFLVEMDGLKQRQAVIVIGATNRPNILDPALIRPGRFDQIVNLELPGKQKRIEILKFYGKKLQVDKTISWNYLAKRTKGFSAADIAAAMNESTIQSIIDKSTHTIETIERGIDLVTSYNSDSLSLENGNQSYDSFFLNRLAYYQAGKAILPGLIQTNPSIVVLSLWPRPKNARHTRLYETYFTEITNKQTLESELISLYAGKAAEIIPLYGNKISISLKRWHSDLGKEDLISATFLANLLVDKWYFYSIQVLIRKNNQILNNRNEKEFIDIEKLEFSNILNTEFEDDLEIEQIAKLSRLGRYQQHGFGPWWQIKVGKETSDIESVFADWYRIYLPDPEETNLNLDWIPPDQYYHNNQNLKKLSNKSSISFNDFYQVERDYIFHGLILNSFNTAFDLLEQKREFLDYFSDYLLRFQIIRENEINLVLKNKRKEKKEFEVEKIDTEEKNLSNESNSINIVDNLWGTDSRRKNSRFLNLETLPLLEKKLNYKSPF